MMNRKQFWMRIRSIVLCITLVLSCLSQVPIVAYAESVMENETEVSTEAEFISALQDESVEVIKLMTDITLSRSDDGMDKLFVIPRSVTIRGGGLIVERAGIILGGAVTFERTNIYFSTAVRNAIIANGYPLTLDTVSNNGSARDIDIFCGGITDYNGGDLNEIPETGADAIVTIKGSNRLTNDSSDGKGGDIYAGSLSDIGSGLEDVANVYSGNVTIIIEDGANGIGKIYGHGARENRDGGFPNDWKPSSSLYKVSGAVTISLKGATTISIDGATGGETNAALVYTDTAYGNMCSPTLKNISSLTLRSSVENVKPHLAPVITDADSCNFSQLVVSENTRLSLVNMEETISASTFIGGGELVFKEGNQTLHILHEASGNTKLAVGDIHSDGVSSTGIISVGHTYISMNEDDEEYSFELLPNSNNTGMIIENDGDGNWTTKVVESEFRIREIISISNINKLESEAEKYIKIPINVTYTDPNNELNYLGDIPMIVTINGQDTIKEYGILGYDFAQGLDDNNLKMWFQLNEASDIDEEELYITQVNEELEFSAGKYDISITIPARYMENNSVCTLKFTITIECEEHFGGTATCKEKAVCEICGLAYGELDLNHHTGGTATCKEKAKCERCGTAYGDLNPNNHAGGTELRGVKEATEDEAGYTGDTYCLGCNTKILDGEVIPKKEVEKILIASAIITLSEENYVYDGEEKKPDITVSLGNKTLVIGDDYTVTYENNAVAGTARVIITGVGKYKGEQIKTFKIHTGGTATCKDKAVCEICGESYGTLDLNHHSGGTATCRDKANCEDCGTAYGELNPSNHTGGTELRGVKEATENETGYTGDTYCLGCNHKLSDGEIIPKKEVEKISIASAKITLSSEEYVFDGKEKKPDITVSLGNKTLVIGDDYTVTYENNAVAGTARVIITGVGKYKGEQIKTFKIHTGGTATCKDKAVCEICGESYGTLDLNHHSGGTATCRDKANCEECGTAYGELNPSSHTGGTELRGVKEATENEAGYTGDTYCLGCNVKLASGKEIPKLPKPEDPTPPEPEDPVIPEEVLKKGDKFDSGKYKYIVTSDTTVAFNGIVSTNTKKISIPKTVTYKGKTFKVTSIADNALKGKSLITSVIISDNITKIGKNAFYGCKKLKTITINTQKLSKIGTNALKGIYSKASIKVPTKKYAAYQKLFQKKGQGKKVSIVIFAKKGDTFSVSNNKYKIIGSSSVEFTGLVNAKKKEVTIPKTIKYGGKTFQVTVVAEKALKGNTKVKKITIGENVKEIEAYAFYGCKNLKTIQIKSTKLKYVGKNACKGIHSKATIKVPKKKWKEYKELFKNKGQGRKVQISK